MAGVVPGSVLERDLRVGFVVYSNITLMIEENKNVLLPCRTSRTISIYIADFICF